MTRACCYQPRPHLPVYAHGTHPDGLVALFACSDIGRDYRGNLTRCLFCEDRLYADDIVAAGRPRVVCRRKECARAYRRCIKRDLRSAQQGGKLKNRWEEFKLPAHIRRAQRLFRYHVRSNYNPRGRIHREECTFCVRWKLDQKTPTEAHHSDYKFPFRIVWVCDLHHRAIERGDLHVGRRDVFDYTSLIDGVAKFGLRKVFDADGASALEARRGEKANDRRRIEG